MAQRLRVVTINTGKGDGLYHRRIPWLVEQLAELSPAIIACQEVFVAAAAGAHTGQALAEGLAMHLAYSPARRKRRRLGERDVDSESGMALLSRKPWTAFETVTLPCDPRDRKSVV